MLACGGAPARSGVEVFLSVGGGRSLLRVERREYNRHKSKTAITEGGWWCKIFLRFLIPPLTNQAVCAYRGCPQWRSEIVSCR